MPIDALLMTIVVVAIFVAIIAVVLALSGISWLTGQAPQEASSSPATSMPTSTSPSARAEPWLATF